MTRQPPFGVWLTVFQLAPRTLVDKQTTTTDTTHCEKNIFDQVCQQINLVNLVTSKVKLNLQLLGSTAAKAKPAGKLDGNIDDGTGIVTCAYLYAI